MYFFLAQDDMVFLYHPLYDRNIKRKDVFHYEKILLAFGLHCFLYSNFTRDTHCYSFTD